MAVSWILSWWFGIPGFRAAPGMPEYVAILNYKDSPCAIEMIFDRRGLRDLAEAMPCSGQDYNGMGPKIQRVAPVFTGFQGRERIARKTGKTFQPRGVDLVCFFDLARVVQLISFVGRMSRLASLVSPGCLRHAMVNTRS